MSNHKKYLIQKMLRFAPLCIANAIALCNASAASTPMQVTDIPGIAEYCRLAASATLAQDFQKLDATAKNKIDFANKTLEKLAVGGEPQAQFLRATFLLQNGAAGQGDKNKIYSRAVKLMYSSADAGFPPAQFNAYIFALTESLPMSGSDMGNAPVQARKKYLEPAAMNGSKDAVLSLLGTCGIEGEIFIKPDSKTCVRWQLVLKSIPLISAKPEDPRKAQPLPQGFIKPKDLAGEALHAEMRQGAELAKAVRKNRDVALEKFPLLQACSYFP